MSLLLNERYTNGKAETVHSPISLRVGNNMQITFIRSQVVADHYAIVSIRLDLTCPKFKVFWILNARYSRIPSYLGYAGNSWRLCLGKEYKADLNSPSLELASNRHCWHPCLFPQQGRTKNELGCPRVLSAAELSIILVLGRFVCFFLFLLFSIPVLTKALAGSVTTPSGDHFTLADRDRFEKTGISCLRLPSWEDSTAKRSLFIYRLIRDTCPSPSLALPYTFEWTASTTQDLGKGCKPKMAGADPRS